MFKNLFIAFFLALYSNFLFAEGKLSLEPNLALIDDLPSHNIKKVAFFIGDLSIIETQINLISQLREVEFFILVSSELSKNKEEILKRYNFENVTIKFLDHPLTSWTQDRLLRSKSQVSSVFSDHTTGVYSLYETATTDHISNFFKFTNNDYSEDLYLSKFTGKDPIITNKLNKKFLHLSKSSLFYGDGGDRLVTNKFIFLGGNSYEKIKPSNVQKIESLTDKKIIQIDNVESNRYAFHLDLFLTFINDENVILGSYEEALKILPSNLSWIDYEFMQKRIEQEHKIITQLKTLGVKVSKIPLIFKKDSGYISFNNGIYNQNLFFTSNYNFNDSDIDNQLNIIKNEVKKTFYNNGISLVLINGGENNIKLGGQVRCTTAILDY